MPRLHLLTVALLLAAVPSLQAQNASKKLYCWNENGRKVCGDALPAHAVDSARTEYGASGRANSRIDRALTAAERMAAEERAATERQAAEAAAAEHRRLMAMVESFANEDELRRAFSSRIELNKDSVKTAEMGVKGLRESLVELLRRAGEAELAKRPVPKKLVGDIQGQHAQLVQQQGHLARMQREAGLIREQLDEALARYRELKGGGPATATPATPVA